MKRISISLAALAAAVVLIAAPALFADNSLTSQDTASEAAGDDYITRDYDFQGFNKLDVGGRFHVIFTKSNDYSITLTIPSEAENLVSVRVEERTLKIGWNRNFTERIQKKLRDKNFTAEISMPELTELEMSGAATFETEERLDLPNGEFSLDLSGASRVNSLRVNAMEIEIDVSGAGYCGLGGNFDKAEIEVSGAAQADFDIYSEFLDLDVSGASGADLEGEFGRVKADVSGASTVTLSGSAESLSAEVSGASKLRAKSLEVKDITTEVSGASNCTVYATRSLTVENATGASSVRYKAPKNVQANVLSISRSSSVQRLD